MTNSRITEEHLPADFDVEEVLTKLSLLDQVKLIRGGNGFSSSSIPEQGIPSIRMVDGPSGCRGTKVFNGTRANCFPCAAGMGSSFNLDLVKEVADQLAFEARSKSSHILLGPTLNVIRSPLAGRGFEMFSEDPFLIGKMGGAYIKKLQSNGVIACMKHFVGNEQEMAKHTAETVISDRALREIYLEPFRIALREGNPWSVMASYSKIRGAHGSESQFMIDEILRKEWGFEGAMIADWYGTHSTGESIKAGCDLEMPGPTIWRSDAQVMSHLEAELLSKEDIAACARRMLQLLKHALQSGIPFEGGEVALDTPKSRALLRRAASEAVVLLKNDKKVLPIGNKGKPLKSIGVIGFNASQHFSSGGGAASVPLETFANTPLAAITAAAKDHGAQVNYTLGTVAYQYVPVGDSYFCPPGDDQLNAKLGVASIDFWCKEPSSEWKSTDGDLLIDTKPDYTFISPSARCFMHDGVPDDIVKEGHYVRFVCDFTPDQGGDWRIGLNSIDRANLFVDGKLAIGYDKDLKPGTMFFNWCHEERSVVLPNLNKGQKYKIELRCWDSPKLHGLPVKMPAGFCIGVVPELDPNEAIEKAVQLAKDSDECIVMVGLNKEFESEGYDRKTMKLPGTTDALIAAVLAAQPNAIIVTQSGMPVEMPWASDASTILHAFYGGTSLGDGLADVIFGKVNPSAKLPISFPKRLEDSTSYPHFAHLSPSHKKVIYAEDIFVGYRLLDRVPERVLFPFGHGLSYTTFKYQDFSTTNGQQYGDVSVTFSITNNGAVAGAEVAQVYVRQLSSELTRPLKELKGFTKVFLESGAKQEVTVSLDKSSFAYWDDRIGLGSWRAEAGEYEIIVASSSVDVQLVQTVKLDRTETWRGL